MRVASYLRNHYKEAFSCVIITNGTLADSGFVNKIKKYGLTEIVITIDGPEWIHNQRRPGIGFNSYERIINNLINIQHLTAVLVNIVIDETNYLYVDSLLHDFQKRGISNVRIGFNTTRLDEKSALTMARKAEIMIKTARTIKQNGYFQYSKVEHFDGAVCMYKKQWAMAFDTDGGLYPCNACLCDEQSMVFDLEMRLLEGCYKCKYLPICFGGCPYERFHIKVDYCEKELYDKTISDLLKIYYSKEV